MGNLANSEDPDEVPQGAAFQFAKQKSILKD